MRAETLGTLLTRLRAETGRSLNVAQGVNERDSLIYELQRTQEELFLNYEWPFMRHSEVITVNPGDYVADVPASLDPDRISHVFARAAGSDGSWGDPLMFLDNPAVRDPGEGDLLRALPTMWWRILEPSSNTLVLTFLPRADQPVEIKIAGLRPLLPFVEVADRSTLDGTLIVLAASVAIAARSGDKALGIKQARMQTYFAKLRGRMLPRRQGIIVGGGGTPFGGGRFTGRRVRVRGVD